MKIITRVILSVVLINLLALPNLALKKENNPVFEVNRLSQEEREFYFLQKRTFLRGRIKKTSDQLSLSVVGAESLSLTVESHTEGLVYNFDGPSGGASCAIPYHLVKKLAKGSSGSLRDRLGTDEAKSLMLAVKPFRLFVNSVMEKSSDLLVFFQYLAEHRAKLTRLDPVVLEAFDTLSPRMANTLSVGASLSMTASLSSPDLCDIIVEAAERTIASCDGDSHCIQLILTIVIFDYLIPYGCLG